MPVQKVLLGKCLLDSGYAVIIVTISESEVPTSMREKVFRNPIHMNALPKTFIYAPIDGLAGMSDRLVIKLELNDAERR
jgi:hypothetical protein